MKPTSRRPPAEPRILATDLGSASANGGSARQTLPEDLLRDASRRLGVVCLASAGLWAANFVLVHLVHPMPGSLTQNQMAHHREWMPVFDAVGGTSFLVSLGLYWYARGNRRSPRFLLDLALAYEIFIAASIGLLDYAVGTPAGVSWIAVIILLFPSIIPSAPWKTFLTALIAASMDPAAALFWKSRGVQVPEAAAVFMLAAPNYLCALVAPVISHIITRLGREIRKAREMGSYVLEKLIGRGGMGEVWQATHRFLVRPAAIKLIKPEVLSAATKVQADVLVQRFRREARAAANLRSPHTIQLYDFGVAGDGTFYYVMELLNGMDLQSLVEEHGPLPPARTIHILRQVCESLAEAHDRGLVHRDIKPANIQVCCMGQYYDFVKVLDFGLVKSFAADATTDPALSAPNAVAGTPAYLSPESALGEMVDQRTDIYALGCVAFWMLTGRSVFEGQGVVQLMARHIHTPPDPPSRYSLFRIPPLLDEVVLACLAKQPEDRPATARELADRLGECEVGEEWSREHARLWWGSRLEPEAALTLGD